MKKLDLTYKQKQPHDDNPSEKKKSKPTNRMLKKEVNIKTTFGGPFLRKGKVR